MNPLFILGGLTFAQGLLGGSQARKQEKAERKRRELQNIQTKIATAEQINGINAQAISTLDAASRLRLAARNRRELGKGSLANTVAASGLSGASVDILERDIDRQAQEVEQDQNYNDNIAEYNLSLAIKEAIARGNASLLDLNPVTSRGDIFAASLLSTTASVGSTYFSSKFQFGVSNGSASTVTTK